jgi:Na+-translocating ferredoxin:NAD+ oxidoreductase RnfE subunit
MNEWKSLLREARPIFRNGLVDRNPVLAAALGLYPIAAAGFSLRSAGALSLLFFFIALPTQLLLCAFGMLVPRWMRPAAVLLATGIFYLPAAFAVRSLLPGSIERLGTAAALMVCNSALYARAEEYAPEHVFPAVTADVLGCTAGFAVTAFLVSGVREAWLASGGGGADRPFAGFLLLGLLAALLQSLISRRGKRRNADVR